MIVVTPKIGDIFKVGITNQEFVILFGHNGLNVFSHTKNEFEKKHQIKLKKYETNEVNIGKTRYVSWFEDSLGPEYFQFLIFKFLEFSHNNNITTIGILFPRLEHSFNTDINRKRSIINLHETIITISKYNGIYTKTSIKTVDIFSLSNLLIDTLGDQPILVNPLPPTTTKNLITAVAVSVLANDGIVDRNSIMRRFFIDKEKTDEILNILEKIEIISPYNPFQCQTILVNNIISLKQKLELINNENINN